MLRRQEEEKAFPLILALASKPCLQKVHTEQNNSYRFKIMMLFGVHLLLAAQHSESISS